MSDREIRALEQAARSGDPEAARRLRVARLRAGNTPIDRAHAAWLAGDPHTCLDLLLERWRETPAPELGDAIQELCYEVTQLRPPVDGRTRAERRKAWHRIDAEGDWFDVDRLLLALQSFPCKEADRLLRATADWPRDPRHSHALVLLWQRPPPGWRGRTNLGFWTRSLQTLRQIGDPRAVDALRHALDRNTNRPRVALAIFLDERLPELIEALPPAPALSESEGASLASFLASLD